ncbi:glutamate-rich protein 6B isoform X2 [Macrotis lagotis]|uniref:glutamate-rich protein 6B isoform X2 n=1 Tax=Macrotis lagotis TaxID=92651 RepID=UPI003D693DF8
MKIGTKTPSQLSFQSTSLYTKKTYAVPVPADQLHSRLMDIKKSVSIHRSTQTSWVTDFSVPSTSKATENIIWTSKKELVSETKEAYKIYPQENMQASSSTSTYHTIIQCIVKDLIDQERKADQDFVTPHSDVKKGHKKSAKKFKTNFERYKDIYKVILMNKMPHLMFEQERKQEIKIKHFHLVYVPDDSPITSIQDLVELDENWVKKMSKLHQGLGVPQFYKGPEGKDSFSKLLSILFPDGTGQFYYPSGNIAMIILKTKDSEVFTYMIFEDEEKLTLQALLNNMGHATFYDKNKKIWLGLSLVLGFYFEEKERQKAWNWWDSNHHIHVPPYQSIYFQLSPCFEVHIKAQDQVLVTFNYLNQKIRLNMGTKVKAIDSESENILQSKEVLETHNIQEFQTISILLKKMKELSCLTIHDLENFIKGHSPMSKVEEQLRAGKIRFLLLEPEKALYKGITCRIVESKGPSQRPPRKSHGSRPSKAA